MRQAGVLAAAGIVSLEKMVDRLLEDHKRASDLAEGLSHISGVVLDPGTPHTNMVFITLEDQIPISASEVAASMKNRGVLVGVTAKHRFRLVTHYMIDDQAIDQAITVFREVIEGSMI